MIHDINKMIIEAKERGYNVGNVSDTYHTFDELYNHRTILLLALLKEVGSEKAWFSMQHSDGSMFEGMFIAGLETPSGTITYHIEGQFLPLFQKYVKEVPKAPEWDGHTPNDVLVRLIGEEDRKVIENIIGIKDEK